MNVMKTRTVLFVASLCVCALGQTSGPEAGYDDVDASAAMSYPVGGGGRVYAHSGEFRLDRVDMAVPGRGDVSFVFSRTHRSRMDGSPVAGMTDDLGPKWIHRYQERLISDNDGVTRYGPTGRDDLWVLEDTTYVAPAGQFGTLIGNETNGWVLRFPNGKKHRFSADGLLESIEGRWGSTLTITRVWI